MTKLSKAQNDTIEEYWHDFDTYKRKLRLRELELLNEFKETDGNMGGGKANVISDVTGQKAIALLEDKNYNHLKNIVDTIEKLYPTLNSDFKTIVDLRYWDKNYNYYEWDDIAEKLNYSRSQILRKRNALIDLTAERLGWI